ncbi:MAG: STAS domain-containing protein [Deltaproteobacteria bacterium]|nr:STAS domain-containing protein [Deltaproteobacteria bacterium]
MMRNFKITQEHLGDVIFFKLQGYLNDLGGEEVEKLFKLGVKEGQKKFIIDFGKVAYINSIGVSFLVGILETTREKALKVCFTSLSKINEELIDMVGLKKYAATFASKSEALEYLKKV